MPRLARGELVRCRHKARRGPNTVAAMGSTATVVSWTTSIKLKEGEGGREFEERVFWSLLEILIEKRKRKDDVDDIYKDKKLQHDGMEGITYFAMTNKGLDEIALFSSTECLWWKLTAMAPAASTPCRTTSWSTSSASCRPKTPCGHRCSLHVWRHLWKSGAAMFTGAAGPMKECRMFISHLLLSRRCLPLDTFEIRLGEFDANDMLVLNLWFRYAILCKVRVLSLHSFSRIYVELYNRPLVSLNLRRLQLHGVRLYDSAADFSRCPVLEHLELHGCGMYGGTKIVSQSLRHLSIISSSFYDPSYERARVRVCAQNLILLHLDDITEMTPMLDRMPLLVKAFVRLNKWCDDYCCKDDADDDVHIVSVSCVTVFGTVSGGTSCVLLSGLSKAANLALISDPDVVRFSLNLPPSCL